MRSEGLGSERRCRTLHRRDKGEDGRDAYTHIAWSEKANADLTDPDTLEDFRRMLEITVLEPAEREGIEFAAVELRDGRSVVSLYPGQVLAWRTP